VPVARGGAAHLCLRVRRGSRRSIVGGCYVRRAEPALAAVAGLSNAERGEVALSHALVRVGGRVGVGVRARILVRVRVRVRVRFGFGFGFEEGLDHMRPHSERHLHVREGCADGHPREVMLLGALLLEAALGDLVRVRVGVRARARIKVGVG